MSYGTKTPGKPAAAPADPTAAVLKAVTDLAADVADLKQKAAQPAYPAATPGVLFHATTGPVGKDSEPYSIMKAAAFTNRFRDADQCKVEVDTHNRLKAMLSRQGYYPTHPSGSFLVPFATEFMAPETSEDERLVVETRQRVKGWGAADPDEGRWAYAKAGMAGRGRAVTKAFGTTSDAAGGVLVGFPTLGEMVELQRNLEVFARCGCTEISLPANGRIQFPKQTGGTTAYWPSEAAAITESTATTGYLDLEGKKLGLLTKINNELFRYVGPSVEAMLRMDMAMQAALKADTAMLEGTGGTQPKGLITYPSAASWSQGTDKLLTYTVTGGLIQPDDVNKMEGVLPDAVQDAPLTFVMRNQLWGVLSSRRADAVTAADGKGPFVFNLIRSTGERAEKQLNGHPVVTSSQVSATRGGGSASYAILGNFKDWIVGRFGVIEFLTTGLGDTPFVNDQTWLRAVQILDAGPRHAASFVFADAITVA